MTTAARSWPMARREAPPAARCRLPALGSSISINHRELTLSGPLEQGRRGHRHRRRARRYEGRCGDLRLCDCVSPGESRGSSWSGSVRRITRQSGLPRRDRRRRNDVVAMSPARDAARSTRRRTSGSLRRSRCRNSIVANDLALSRRHCERQAHAPAPAGTACSSALRRPWSSSRHASDQDRATPSPGRVDSAVATISHSRSGREIFGYEELDHRVPRGRRVDIFWSLDDFFDKLDASRPDQSDPMAERGKRPSSPARERDRSPARPIRKPPFRSIRAPGAQTKS